MSASTATSPETKTVRLPLTIAVVVLALGAFVARLPLLRVREFDPDELEHLHGAWCIAKGLLPFRDYFEHHMPGMYYLLGWLLNRYDVVHSADAAVRLMFGARTLMPTVAGCATPLCGAATPRTIPASSIRSSGR